MEEALKEAEIAFNKNEVPVGAVISFKDKIIARSHNQVEENKSATEHAEVKVINEASKYLNDWRLKDCTLCVTLEPCSMCLGAIRLSRISNLIFGAKDPSMGACGSVHDFSLDPKLGKPPRVISEFQSEKSTALLKNFFSQIRK
ncbi:UNVERIFIED_CONTAM: hypothetical protein GTU68_022233 [Idotea baltica]|nr:hypothetical protein [Idotea baltica]